jgi:DNA replication protein DnaC
VTDDERARAERKWVTCGVPEQEVKLVMRGQLIDTPAMGFVKEWVAAAQRDDGPTMLVLAGPKGVGKTVAAVYAMMTTQPPPPAASSAWPAERNPRFRHVSDVAELGLWGEEANRKARGELKQCKVLVIDDVGAEYMSEAFLAAWDSLVNARYGSIGHTIFTTNLTHEKFALRYGDRVYDRIRGRGEWYDIDGESMRGRPR